MDTSSGDILTIRQLAEYLMVSEKTVYRMLDRNQLPAVRVGAQWRFRRRDIDGWLSDEVRRIGNQGSGTILESVGGAELAVTPLLAPENIWLSPGARSRDDLLRLMIERADLDAQVDREQLFQSVRDRETLCSTALLEDAAFPQPLEPGTFRFSQKRVLLAVEPEALDYLDPHGHRPRIFVMILARSAQGHLLAFSRALKLFGGRDLVAELVRATNPIEAIEHVRNAEATLERALAEEESL